MRYHPSDHIDPRQVEWAPTDITGFYDDQPAGKNRDYLVARETLCCNMNGWELYRELIG